MKPHLVELTPGRFLVPSKVLAVELGAVRSTADRTVQAWRVTFILEAGDVFLDRPTEEEARAELARVFDLVELDKPEAAFDRSFNDEDIPY